LGFYQFGAAKCPVGFGVPTEATKDTEKVTNLGTALDNFLRIPATGFLNDIGNDSSKDWVFCATKCFKQITEQYEYYILSAGYGYSCKVFNP
jgi:hypothetical protein